MKQILPTITLLINIVENVKKVGNLLKTWFLLDVYQTTVKSLTLQEFALCVLNL